jgi:Tol biopolymer transport system component
MFFLTFNFITALILVLSNCKGQDISYPETIGNSLLYLEDISNTFGTLEGKFGDLIVHNLSTKKYFHLTDDQYYDLYPSFSRKYNLVVFSSLRNHQTISGISYKLNLFAISLNNKRLKQFDKKIIDLLQESFLDDYIEQPSFNPLGDKVIFLKSRALFKSSILIYNLNSERTELLVDSLYGPISYTWSISDSLIYFSPQYSKKAELKTNSIDVVNVFSKKRNRVLIKKGMNLEVSDVLNEQICYLGYYTDGSGAEISIYDLKNKDDIKTIRFNDLDFQLIKSPKFKDSTNIYFIGQKYNLDEDIYLLNLENGDLNQVTFTQGQKEHLSYIN